MKQIFMLLRPRLLSIWNIGKNGTKNSRVLRILILGGIGSLVWGGIFWVALRILNYFHQIEQIGFFLALKLLSMLILISFALLIFSSILTALSRLYLSSDLTLVHSLPVPAYKIFIARWLDSTAESSWMVILYTLPVFIVYGIVFEAGLFYFISLMPILLSLTFITSALSSIMVVLAVLIIPANRMKTVFILLGIIVFVVLYMAFRLLKPEQLVDPDVFSSVLVYIQTIQTPSSPYLPSTWAYDAMQNALLGNIGASIFHLMLSISFGFLLYLIIMVMADLFYFKGISKTQTAAVRLFYNNNTGYRILSFLPSPLKALTVKEIKTFMRDQTQWTQIFLIVALVIIYVYNFKVLPIEKSPIRTIYLQNLLAFLNMGLALFVLTAITARFAYPAVSAERDAFWIVKISPVSLRQYLWIKFIIYYLPLIILAETLIISTNIMLNVTPVMMIISAATVFFAVPGIVSLGIGLGAAYPDFKAENPAQTVTSFGGLIFMLICAMYIGMIIILQAGPVYSMFMADIRGKALTSAGIIWIFASFILVFVLNILFIVLPIRFGEKRLAAALK